MKGQNREEGKQHFLSSLYHWSCYHAIAHVGGGRGGER